LRESLPTGTTVLAGSARLRREISRVVTLKPRMPGLEPLQGGELVLLSLRTLRILDPDLSPEKVLQSISSDASAVAVLGDAGDDLAGEAESLRLPLLQLPPHASVREVEQAATRLLLERRTEWYARKHAVQQALTAAAVGGVGLQGLANQMVELSGCAAIIGDGGDPVIALPPDFDPQYAEQVEQFARGSHSIPEMEGSGESRQAELARVLATGRSPRGGFASISLVGPPENLGPEAGLVVESGLTAVTIELSRTQAGEEVAQRIGGDVVSELVRGEGEARDLMARAKRVGFDLEGGWIAIALAPDDSGEENPEDGPAEMRLRQLRGAVERIVRAGSGDRLNAASHRASDAVTLFQSVAVNAPGLDVRRLVDRAYRDVARVTPVRAGVSDVHSGPTSFRESSREAAEALRLGRELSPSRSVTYFYDLGVHRLLLELKATDPLHAFHDHLLGRLSDYDRGKNADLVATLAAWLQGPNGSAVAKRLNLHRNTLNYRIRRVGEITGLDLEDSEVRFALRLALKIGETLNKATH
jgi:PucR family transcriptional regulator, purine catabolism regulatory protein